ncbi:NUDIX domain-containing protein [Pseudoxanthomonas suwonensis]|uniref:NUDIX domain-containing protein n=1 Tax=Pseudoxanthomonas suwonensis TaxID=314722 RepID=UPI00130E3F39|nr:NUDIX domain-containing protein [Pseudoxanthomonas suwonensis]
MNERGERLVAVHPPGDAAAQAAAFALVIARHETRVLLVRNARRAVWELPGGWIDAGERAEECALRELREESGQAGHGLRPLAHLLLERPRPEGGVQVLAGLLFAASVHEPVAFMPTTEISAVGFWAADELPEDISPIDAELVARYGRE